MTPGGDHPSAASPVAGLEYPAEATWLYRFAPCEADERLTAFVEGYRSMAPAEAAATRAALTADDFDLMTLFAFRCVLADLNDHPLPTLRDGATALTTIDEDRSPDWRDTLVAGWVLAAQLERRGLDREEFLRRAAYPGEALSPSVERVASGTETSSGWTVIRTPEGLGLASTHFKRFAPTVDLVAIAWAVKAVVEAGGYWCRGLDVETDLEAWALSSNGGQATAAALEAALGFVSLTVTPKVEDAGWGQHVLVQVGEAASATDANVIASAAVPDGDDQVLGVSSGPLVCVFVARPYAEGVEPYERDGSLERFRDPIAAALAQR